MDESVANNNGNFRECANSPKRRHWCVTAWLILVAIRNVILVLHYGVEEIESLQKILLMANSFSTLFCIYLLSRWNKWGLYLYVGAILVAVVLASFGFLISSNPSETVYVYSYLRAVKVYILPLYIVAIIFRLKGPDGRTFFENLGIRRYSKKKK